MIYKLIDEVGSLRPFYYETTQSDAFDLARWWSDHELSLLGDEEARSIVTGLAQLGFEMDTHRVQSDTLRFLGLELGTP